MEDVIEETKRLMQEVRASRVKAHNLFKEIRDKKLYKSIGYKRLIDYVRGEDLPYGSCFWCGEDIKDADKTFQVTCSLKCQKRWYSLQKPRQEERYSCKRCGVARQPHGSHKTGLCRKCMFEVALLNRRPDLENIGKCLDCGTEISRSSYRCKKCGSFEKWRLKARKPEVLLRRKIRRAVSGRLRSAMNKYLATKKNVTVVYLGCSIEELIVHLEDKFVPGMTWENHGLFGWHIDHIRPISSFDFSDEEQIKTAFHFTNLQPLWAFDNIKKSNKIL